MKDLKEEKKILRAQIQLLKKQHNIADLLDKSAEVMSVIEVTGVFQEARNIFIYSAMSDEVATLDFILKWQKEKFFYLPVALKENEIVFRKYESESQLKESAFGILEPEGIDFTDYNKIDLIIVPGVAFDRMKNRLGYGKGYYDRFLTKLKVPKMGICFDFQLLDNIPFGDNDVKMDYIISENDLIW